MPLTKRKNFCKAAARILTAVQNQYRQRFDGLAKFYQEL